MCRLAFTEFKIPTSQLNNFWRGRGKPYFFELQLLFIVYIDLVPIWYEYFDLCSLFVRPTPTGYCRTAQQNNCPTGWIPVRNRYVPTSYELPSLSTDTGTGHSTQYQYQYEYFLKHSDVQLGEPSLVVEF